jgi:hypothetical protein
VASAVVLYLEDFVLESQPGDNFRWILLWRIDQLLDKDLETNNQTTAVAMQQRGKRAPTTIVLLLETML